MTTRGSSPANAGGSKRTPPAACWEPSWGSQALRLALFGLAGLAIAFSGVAGFMADQTLFRWRQPPLDGFVGEDQLIDGMPVNEETTWPLVVAIFMGIVMAMFGLTLGADQVLVWMGR